MGPIYNDEIRGIKMRKIGLVVLILGMVIFASSCSNGGYTPGGNTPGGNNGGIVPDPDVNLSGVYTGKMTLDTINEAYISTFRTEKELDTIDSAVDAKAAKSAESLIVKKYQDIITGAKSLAKEGSLTLKITNNDKKKNIAGGDYMFTTIAYNKFLPENPDGSPYWALFNDLRNGEMTISADSKRMSLINKANGGNDENVENDVPVYSYRLEGNISGNKITGTWSQLWNSTEVYGGKFEVDRTAS